MRKLIRQIYNLPALLFLHLLNIPKTQNITIINIDHIGGYGGVCGMRNIQYTHALRFYRNIFKSRVVNGACL